MDSGPLLANISTIGVDLLEWTGSAWAGASPTAELTIPPPGNTTGDRAIFTGSGVVWTTGGEGYGLLLDQPLLAGETYSFTFTYVSHGLGSDGDFSPNVYTNDTPSLFQAEYVADLEPVGFTWASNVFTFTANAEQDGHTWLVIHSGLGGSGLMFQMCNVIEVCALELGDDLVLCDGDSASLDAGLEGATYEWQDGSTDSVLQVTGTGTYWVDVTAGLCVLSDTIDIVFTPVPEVDLGNDTAVCAGSELVLNASFPDADYLWQDGSEDAELFPSESGLYWSEVSLDGCSFRDSIQVTFLEDLSVQLGADTLLTCPDETLVLEVQITGGQGLSTIEWQDGSDADDLLVTDSGEYWVVVSSLNCMGSDTVQVLETPLPMPLNLNLPSCKDVPISEEVIPPGLELLVDGQNIIGTSFSESGIIQVLLSNENCTIEDSVFIDIQDAVEVDLGLDRQLCFGENLTLVSGLGSEQLFFWQDGTTEDIYPVTDPGIYALSIETACGLVSDTIMVVVIDCDTALYIPDAFSPDGDGVNDFFFAEGVGLSYYHMKIYDRWGNLIFETDDIEVHWNGGNMNSDYFVSDGVFPYLVEYSFDQRVSAKGKADRKKYGFVTVLR